MCISDEVQSGFGRAGEGKMWGFELGGVEPVRVYGGMCAAREGVGGSMREPKRRTRKRGTAPVELSGGEGRRRGRTS